MRLRVLYFAAVRDLMPVDAETIDATGVRTVRELTAWLEEHREPLRGRLASVRIARNEAFATPDEALTEDDVIALIPPVAGG